MMGERIEDQAARGSPGRLIMERGHHIMGLEGGTRHGLHPATGRALSGLSIAITRPIEQAKKLADAVRAHGGTPVLCPTIRIAEARGKSSLQGAVDRIQEYDWIVFTSANGVASFWASLNALEVTLPARARLAAIGPATARALELRGARPQVVPDEFVAEAVADALIGGAGDLTGQRILLPRAAGARNVLPERLRAAGARVDVVEAYRAVPDREGIDRLRRLLERGEVDVVTFTAASTVRYFARESGSSMGRVVVATIGPITAAAARHLGIRVDVVAGTYTIQGLVIALCEHFRHRTVEEEREQGTR